MAAVCSKGAVALLPNVWLGASVESGEYLDRLTHLRSVRESSLCFL